MTMKRFIPNPSSVPPELAARKQWVVWRWGKTDKNGNAPKIPLVRVNGKLTADGWNDDPSRFETFDVVTQRLRDNATLAGCGVVLRHELNPPGQFLVAFDIDDHDPNHARPIVADGKIVDPIARQLVETVNSYTEVTPSGFGLRVLTLASELPPGITTSVTTALWRGLPVEIYVSKFITFTGQRLDGTAPVLELRYLHPIAQELTKPEITSPGNGPRRIPKSSRHDFFRRKLTVLVKDGWITDRDMLVKAVTYLRDAYCESPEEKTDLELESFVDWALLRLKPNPLWQKNDAYLASRLVLQDSKYAAAWRGDLTLFGGDLGQAFDYVANRLLEVCNQDPQQASRIFQESPINETVENFLQEKGMSK